jgi:hypothetical protein
VIYDCAARDTESVNVTVKPEPNQAPIANAGERNQTFECQGALTNVTLDGSNSSDPDGAIDILSYEWKDKETGTILGDFRFRDPVALVQLSRNESRFFTLTVKDPYSESSSDEVMVNVVDTTPPTLSVPSDMTVNNEHNSCDASVTPGVATATDLCEGAKTPVGTRSDGNALDARYPVGTTIITWTATDSSGHAGSRTQTITVNDVDPPEISCPSDITAGNDPGQCSKTLDPGTATATDRCSGPPTLVGTRNDGKALSDPYPVGTTTITWTATDTAGNAASCTQTIKVNDVEAPVISGVSVTPNVLWPPNHKLVDVTVNYTAKDNCDPNPVCWLTATSNEPDNGLGGGDTSGDIEIVDAHHTRLRAERAGNGSGRIYTNTAHCKDLYLNEASTNVTCTVPHDQ